MFFTGKWWALVVRGIAAIIFGLLALFAPNMTVGVLLVLFAAYALIDGAFAIAASINGRNRGGHWPAMLIRGIAGILASIAALTLPAMTALILLYLIAAWAVVTGIVEIAAAIHLRRVVKGEWMLVASGAISVLFGVVLMAFPGPGILAVVWLIGAYAIAFGALMIGLGIALRAQAHRISDFEERVA
jgi:uncharacterized membrane protein HdeD (DUF308 family)